jgi:hypothetical protein
MKLNLDWLERSKHSPSCDEKGEEVYQEGPNIQKLCEICKIGLWTQMDASSMMALWN